MGSIPHKSTRREAVLSSEDYLAALLQAHLDYLLYWEVIARSSEEPEGVAQLNEGIIRLQIAMAIFHKALPPVCLDRFLPELLRLEGLLGQTGRTLLMIHQEFIPMIQGIHAPAEQTKQWMEWVEHYRQETVSHVRQVLASDRYKKWSDQLLQWVDQRGWRLEERSWENDQALRQPIRPAAMAILQRQWRQLLTDGRRMDESVMAENSAFSTNSLYLYHSSDFFSPIFGSVMQEYLMHLARLRAEIESLHHLSSLPARLRRLLADKTDPELTRHADAMIKASLNRMARIRLNVQHEWHQFTILQPPWQDEVEPRKPRAKARSTANNSTFSRADAEVHQIMEYRVAPG